MRRLLMFTLLLCLTTVGMARAAERPAGPFVVFFQTWSAALGPAAQGVIRDAAGHARARPGAVVQVNGFADPTGSRRANTLLADLRMRVVIDRLHADGVPSAQILGRGHGAVRFAITAQESRRVEIGFRRR